MNGINSLTSRSASKGRADQHLPDEIAIKPRSRRCSPPASRARCKGQLAFEHQARPELEATVARLDIDFAQHVRPTADMLWSRINKHRILDIARSVLSPAWASARSKNKKPDLAKAMEQAFAAGDPPLGLSADMHAAALAWVPPEFAAFVTQWVSDRIQTGVCRRRRVSGLPPHDAIEPGNIRTTNAPLSSISTMTACHHRQGGRWPSLSSINRTVIAHSTGERP